MYFCLFVFYIRGEMLMGLVENKRVAVQSLVVSPHIVTYIPTDQTHHDWNVCFRDIYSEVVILLIEAVDTYQT